MMQISRNVQNKKVPTTHADTNVEKIIKKIQYNNVKKYTLKLFPVATITVVRDQKGTKHFKFS